MTQKNKNPDIWQGIWGVLSAMLGVQSQRNAEADFKQPSITLYVILGIIFTAAFVLTLYLVVQLVLP